MACSSTMTDNYFCNHCNKIMLSLDEVEHHECFRGQTISMDENNIFCIENPYKCRESYGSPPSKSETIFDDPQRIEEHENYESVEYLLDEDEMVLPPNPSQRCNPDEINKSTAVWNKKSTLALLSLYEANYDKMDSNKKKKKIWSAISTGLEELNIKMSTEQVRHKIYSLLKKYKECVDNNSRSGRGPMTFEFYDEMEEIFHLGKDATAQYTASTSLPSKKGLSCTLNVIKTKTKNVEQELPTSVLSSTSKSTILKMPSTSDNLLDQPSVSLSASSNVKDIENKSGKNDSTRKRNRPQHGSGSNIARSKLELNTQWLQHLQNEEQQRIIRDERHEKLLKAKNEALQLKKRHLQIQERSLDIKKTLAANKLKTKERRHDELIELEKLKCKLLSKLLKEKENIDTQDSDDSD